MIKKATIIVTCSLLYSASQAQNIQGYWYSAEGDNYYQLLHALPQSSAAFYSQHSGGRILHTQPVNTGGMLCYKAEHGKSAALVLNKAATGNTLLHFRKKEFTIQHIQAEQLYSSNVLKWEAAVTEPSLYEIVVLKSMSDGTFKEAAVIEPYSTDLTGYSWTDNDPSVQNYQLQIRNKQNDFRYLSRIVHAGSDIALIYPTSISHTVHVDMNITPAWGIFKISNLQGQTLQGGVLNAEQNTITINDLAAGVYFMNIYTVEGGMTQKLVKE